MCFPIEVKSSANLSKMGVYILKKEARELGLNQLPLKKPKKKVETLA
ncbi:hypothetical protein [Bacillus sp. SA1-12]|nr:hypothetical protein [Bacillus sp. SA1-12]